MTEENNRKSQENQDDRDDPKRIAMARALLGTCLDPDFDPEAKYKQLEEEPKIMKSRCTYCSDQKGWKIRNRNLRSGVYGITKKEAEQFAEVGGFKLPPKEVRNETRHIVVTNFCNQCELYGEKDKPTIKHAELMKFSDFLLKFPEFKKYHPLSS